MDDKDASELSAAAKPFVTSDDHPTNAFHAGADRIETSLQTSTGALEQRTGTESTDSRTTFFAGVSGNVDTPSGGVDRGIGVFVNSAGAVGTYESSGMALGYLGASGCLGAGYSESFAGDSLNLSVSAGEGVSGAVTMSLNPETLHFTGVSVSLCVSVGTVVGVSGSSTKTTTTESDAAPRIYQDFLNSVGYPSPSLMQSLP
ncbi:hypothetical protein [Paraburkholderia monticola]|uniref:hypothetical protein n=1 Tax=Paraburkholderia monticola TaxID=1399968 RepID=UPI000ABD6707|nr:hypothetical protein [Paraburkholderia monticola]